jgi:hypothetical protein
MQWLGGAQAKSQQMVPLGQRELRQIPPWQ